VTSTVRNAAVRVWIISTPQAGTGLTHGAVRRLNYFCEDKNYFYSWGAAGNRSYSQGVRAGNFIFTAGQIPLDPATQQDVASGITNQTTRALENLKARLRREEAVLIRS